MKAKITAAKTLKTKPRRQANELPAKTDGEKSDMAVTAQQVKQIREKTGAGLLDCKRSLERFDGDMDKAVEFLKRKALQDGIKLQSKGRSANEGVIGNYLHFDRRLAVIVEVNCETDFVAATDRFQAFAKDIAMHIANLNPQCVAREDVPLAQVAAETQRQLERARQEGKPERIVQKIVAGRLDKWYEDIVLMEQPFIKDDSKTILQYLQETAAEVGETINIGRFKRIAIGDET